MKITDIKAQQKHQNRVSIDIDGEYSFSLTVWQLGNLKLKIGDELNPAQIEEYKDESNVGKLLDKTLNWLAIRPRSKWEVEDYLSRKTKDLELRNAVYDRVEQGGYIDDHDFAERWVSNRRLLKPMSKYRIKQELIKKRVPKEVIEDTLSKDETDEVEVAKELIIKRQKRYKDQQKLMAYMSRQGFSYGTIKQALSEIEESQ
ncbi:MAG: RecX family transcriptional regulator [Candidatus Saccharimonadales bacterium]|nr:RecX family transcriptional regulator [Candidatus Saccharimonadales bacterium]